MAKIFHSPNCQVALKYNRGFKSKGRWNNDLALQALTRFEPLFRDAIKAFAAEIFGGALGWRYSRLSEQIHGTMYGNALLFAAITA